LFNPVKDKKSIYNSETYFYIEGKRFLFNKEIHKIDTCNIKYLKKIKITKASDLEKDSYSFYIEKIKEDDYWKDKVKKHPMPVKINSYVKVVLVSIENKNILKYDVFWE